MHNRNIQATGDIYENDFVLRELGKEITGHNAMRMQPFEVTGTDSVKKRSSRAAPVCLALLCFLLLTAVIVLCVFIYTNNTSYTQERNQLLSNITNITEEKDQLLTRISNITQKKDQLLTRISNLTEERVQLLTKNKYLTEERDTLTIKNLNWMTLKNQLNNTLQIVDGWIYYKFSFYHVFNDSKNWTESRRDCLTRGADLVIINNRQEQDFVMNITYGKECWIGLTDSEEEGRWKWVDGSNMTSPFWGSNALFKEPNGGTAENCAVSYLKKVPSILGWLDERCNYGFQWICEKSISPLIQP